jgi:TonB family protein
MRRIVAIVFTLLAVTVFGQTAPTRISPEVAAKHLSKDAPRPTYPPLAQEARIQGNVILEIRIDESGTASVRRLISGHPMLAPAAIAAVNRWKYQPFEVDGKPAIVNTVVLVPFGNASYYAAEGRAEMAFQNDFWTTEESAETALAKGDYARSEEQLNKAKDLVSPDSKDTRHIQERWQWMTTMGRLRMSQQKYEEAEQYYKNALALREDRWGDKNSPEIAALLANLAALFAEEKRFDLARDHAVRALAMLEKNFEKAGSGNPGAREVYGRAIAQESWLLLKLAKKRNDVADADKQCRTILDFQSFLNITDRDSVVSACQLDTTNTETKQ